MVLGCPRVEPVADADPDYTTKAVARVDEVVRELDADSSVHAAALFELFAAAWKSCVRGRLRGVARRTNASSAPHRVHEKRNQARVAAWLALRWASPTYHVGIEDGDKDDVARLQMAISSAILKVVEEPDFPSEHRESLTELCRRTDTGDAYLDLVRSKSLRAKQPANWQAMRAGLLTYIKTVDVRGEQDFRKLYAERIVEAREIAKLPWSPSSEFLERNTRNLYGDTKLGFPPVTHVMRHMVHADIDAFILANYVALEPSPYDAPLDERPTRMMLGAFPDVPLQEESAAPAHLAVDEQFGETLRYLTLFADDLDKAEFTTTTPLVHHACTKVEQRLEAVSAPPRADEVATVSLAAEAARVDGLVAGAEDEQQVRCQVLEKAQRLLLADLDNVHARAMELIAAAVAPAARSGAPATRPADHVSLLAQSAIRRACRALEENVG